MACEKVGDLKRAVDQMQISVDFERQIGHTDAEKYADYLENVRARLEKEVNLSLAKHFKPESQCHNR
jgi:hypothetical protein